MTHKLRIEMDRGNGWELRSEGEVPNDATIEFITVCLRNYAIRHPQPGGPRWRGRGKTQPMQSSEQLTNALPVC